MDVNTALEGVRRVLREEKKDGNCAAAVKNCQAIRLSVQQLLQTVERHRSADSCNGGQEETTRELPGHLCTCFSVSAGVLDLCKEVEAGPSWLFEELSPQLSALFKSTFTLIKVSTELLDRLSFSQETFEAVVSSLQCLCTPVLNFDPSLPVLVWRGVGKVVCRGRGVASDEWTIRPIISDICIAMETKAVECVKSAPREAEQSSGGDGARGGGQGYVKLLKLCRFLSSLLVKLVQEFQEDSPQFGADVAGMLVRLYGSVPPSPHCGPVASQTQAEIDCNILLVCEPVFCSLLDCCQFLNCLTSAHREDEEGEGGWFGRLMCLSLLLKHFPKLSGGMQESVMDSPSSRENQSLSCKLLDSLFSAVRHCVAELQLPVRLAGVMCNGQPQRAVSLYDHILTHLCCFVACLPAHHFPKLESVMFHHVLCDGGPFSFLIALDALTFIARTEERMADRYTNLLAKLLLQDYHPPLSGHAHIASCALLRRMLPLLSPEHLSLFMETHPPSSPSSHPSLWAHLSLSTLATLAPLHKELAERVEREERWREGGEDTAHTHHPNPVVVSKFQLLLETWNELCTLPLPPDVCQRLRELCTSIQSHLSQSHQFSSTDQK